MQTNKYRVIDRESWPRTGMFDFYNTFDNACFNVSVAVEGENLHACSRDREESFFLLALYGILRAANAVPQLRQRVVGDDILEYEKIAVMTPIMTEQEMFRQIWCEYAPTFPGFVSDAAAKVAAAKQGEPCPAMEHGDDYFVASCVPWLHFTAVSQADLHFGQTVPILAWGKMKNGLVPFACKFNHAFVDGLHVARFFECIENSFANPDALFIEALG